jgi:bifunctional DNase/RNase
VTEAVKYVKFVVHLLQAIGIKVEMPITIKVDDAIFMAENMNTNSRTKHIFRFVREYIEEGGIKIVFVKTEDNKANYFTNNVHGDEYDKHVDDFIAD